MAANSIFKGVVLSVLTLAAVDAFGMNPADSLHRKSTNTFFAGSGRQKRIPRYNSFILIHF
jgi:hypothetical protein